MSQKHYLYVMIAKTDTCFGAFVRMLFGYPYNHCSMTLDPSFRKWVAFGRFHKDAPFFGGFIVEPAERYLAKTGEAQVRIFRLEISPKRYEILQTLFSKAGDPDSGLLYNLFDAVATFFHLRWPVPDAYTCLSFARVVLGKSYPTIRHINDDLMPFLFFEGDLSEVAPDSGDRTDPYFQRISFLHSTRIGTCQVARLITRVIKSGRNDMISQQLQ